MLLGMNFFRFILFVVYWASWTIRFIALDKLGDFQLLFIHELFFKALPSFSLPSRTPGTEIFFSSSPTDPFVHFFFFSLFCICFRLGISYCCIFKFTDSSLSFILMLNPFIVSFPSKISILLYIYIYVFFFAETFYFVIHLSVYKCLWGRL